MTTPRVSLDTDMQGRSIRVGFRKSRTWRRRWGRRTWMHTVGCWLPVWSVLSFAMSQSANSIAEPQRHFKLHPRCSNHSVEDAIPGLRKYGMPLPVRVPLSGMLTTTQKERIGRIITSASRFQSESAQSMWPGPTTTISNMGRTRKLNFCNQEHGDLVRSGNWVYLRLYKCNNDKLRVMMRYWPQPKEVVYFTFVRDPLDRFVSGYRELEYRFRCAQKDIPRNSTLAFVKEEPGSLSRANAFLRDVYDVRNARKWMDYNPLGAFQHVCPYFSGRGFLRRPVHVGTLEKFQESLKELGKVAGGLDLTIGPRVEKFTHDSELDVVANLNRRAMIDILTHPQKPLVLRLGLLYWPDLCTFGYAAKYGAICSPPNSSRFRGLTKHVKMLVSPSY